MEKERIIGKCGNLYMITKSKTATLNDLKEYAYVIDRNGKHYTDYSTINTLLKKDEDLIWTPVDEIFDFTIFNKKQNLSKDALIGFAIGDALGVPVEFLSKEEIKNINITEMMGNDTGFSYDTRWGDYIPAGAWSDDTSMTIATMDAIIKNNGVIDYNKIMQCFMNWISKNEYTSIDEAFGLGNTIYKAFNNYTKGVEPLECGGTGIRDNGNGALMRILPFSLYCIKNDLSNEEMIDLLGKASKLTHGHEINKMSCFIYTKFLQNIIKTKNAHLAYRDITNIDYNEYFSDETIAAHKKLIRPSFEYISSDEINGSGYVVDTLEAVIYSILNAKNYEDAVETAIKTGYDTDTIAGITGSIAGVQYGYDNIPKRWLDKLKKKTYLEKIADSFENTLDITKKKLENEFIFDENSDDIKEDLKTTKSK